MSDPPPDPNMEDIGKMDAEPSSPVHEEKEKPIFASFNQVNSDIKQYSEFLESLLEKELDPCGDSLSPGEYVAFVFMQLVQGKSIDARYTALRGLRAHPKIVEFKNLYELAELAHKNDLTVCINGLKNISVHETFAPYKQELINRYIAGRLEQIRISYSSMQMDDFARSLGFANNDPSISELIKKCGWTTDEEGFIYPTESAGFRECIASLQNPSFSAAEATVKPTKKEDASVLCSLVQYAGLLDRA